MSIVADALDRLRHAEAPSAMPTGQVLEMDHREPSLRLRFWWRSVLTAILVVGIGAGAYWLGLSLVPETSGLSDPPTLGEQPPRKLATAEDIHSETDAQEAIEKTAAPPPSASDLADSKQTDKNAGNDVDGPAVEASDEPPPSLSKEKSPDSSTPLPPPTEHPRTVREAKASADVPAPSKGEVNPLTPRASGLTARERTQAARMFIGKRLYSRAVRVLTPLFASPPQEWEPWFLMGTALLALGHLDEAERYLEDGLARDGTVPLLWIQRALLAQQRGNHELALKALEQAARLAPELPAIQLNMGYSFEAQGKIHRATQHYRRFLALTEGMDAYHSVRKKVLRRVMRDAPSSSRFTADD